MCAAETLQDNVKEIERDGREIEGDGRKLRGKDSDSERQKEIEREKGAKNK